ncbi:MAG: TolC family protein [Proteobacteria bacterium]|nr:TolC family protein [Pseudomonadota bacterium]
MKKYFFICLIALCLCSRAGAATEYTLDALYRIALERSEKIKISAEDLYIAITGKEKAMSFLLPQLSAVGGYTRYRDSKTSDSGMLIQPDEAASYGLRLDQSMSLSGREITAFKISKDNIEKSKFDLFAVKEAYMFIVSNAYYDYLKTKKIVDISKANVERLTKHKNAAATRLKVGEVTKTALLRAEAELSGAQSDLIKTGNFMKLRKAVIARIVGINEDFEVKEDSESGNAGNSSEEIIEGCQLLAVECLKEKADSERAELKSASLQKKIADDTVRVVHGTYWPTVSVEGVYQKRKETPETTSIVRDNIYGGLKFNFPFFEGGLRDAQVKEAGAKKRQTALAYEDLKKSVGIEVESAYLDFITQKGVLQSLEDQYAFAKDNYNAVARQFEYGLANSIDVMDANTLLVTAERQLADATYNYRLSILMIKRTTGVLLKSVMDSEPAGLLDQQGICSKTEKTSISNKLIGAVDK